MQAIIDGTVDFAGGQNSGLTPDRIGKNQFERAVNTSCKNGSIKPRPRLIHIPITVLTKGTEAGVTYQKIFDLGKFQGERDFSYATRYFTISVRSGIIFKIDYERGTAQVLRTAGDDRIAMRHRRVDIKPSGKFIVIHDWPNMPVIIDGDIAKRSDRYAKDVDGLPLPEIPQSTMGVFVQSRYWVANSENEFTAGDFVGDVTRPRSAVTFAEIYNPGAPFVQQAFNLGSGFGNIPISAMGFLSSRNSQSKVQATQYGPLYIATRRSVHIYNAELPRSDWGTSAFGRVELFNTGIVGQRAHTIIGSDVLFQSPEGHIHSLSKNQNDERSGWATTIISREVDDWLRTDNKDFLDVGFITFFDKLVLVGARPIRIPMKGYRGQVIYDYAHEGMVALELDNASTITAQATPVWAGLWTGVRPMEATVVNGKLYVVSKDADGYNRTYVMDEDAIHDSWNHTSRPVKGRLYTRSYDFETPFTNKKEHALELNVGDVKGDLNLKSFRKTLHTPHFSKWGELDYIERCDEPCPSAEEGFAPNSTVGYRIVPFGDPVETICDAASGEYGNVFRESQVMLEFDGGDFTLFKVKLKAEALPEPDSEGTPCELEIKKQPKEQCEFKDDWSMYSICPRVGDK